MASCGSDKIEGAQYIEKGIKWTPDYDLAILSMVHTFTDKELENLGMDLQDIIKYRAHEKRNTVKMTERTENDHNQVSEN